MKTSRRTTGDIGEQVAVQFLEGKGFKVIERNYQKPWGEIDIIAQKGDSIRFVEVKTVTRETGDVTPEELVHEKKLKKVARTAELYMANRRGDEDFQIDVVTVFLDQSTRKARCRLYEQVL